MFYNTKKLLTYSLVAFSLGLAACEKTEKAAEPTPEAPAPVAASFTEDFSNVGALAAKGWIFRNLSAPVGMNGWRQGRYEPVVLGSTPDSKTGANPAIAFIGFPAHSASTTPNDFISCDAACVGFEGGTINAWLISPKMNIKNGDVIEFYTRAVDERNLVVYLKDRLQVRANFTDGTDNVGDSEVSVGSFTTVLEDINSTYINNFDGGFPQEWTKVTITISGLPAAVPNARFAFRYMGEDAGANGPTYAGVVGIDDLSFKSN